ncbi:hypothetical protein GC163_17245 [bacterium]|nr:hypothetical protein [bacterium]
MARQYIMSWDERYSRWFKRTPKKYLEVHPEKQLTVSCRQLNAPLTKAGSYLKANEWLRSKLSELDSLLTGMKDREQFAQYRLELEDRDIILQMAAYLTQKGKIEEANQKRQLANLISESISKGIRPDYSEHEMWGLRVWGDSDEEWLVGQQSDISTWMDRLEREAPIPTEKRVEYWIEHFLDTIRPTTKPQSFTNIERPLRTFQKWFGAETDIKAIKEETVSEHYKYLRKHLDSESYIRDFFRVFQRWVTYLHQQRQIELPFNLRSPEFKFSVSYAPDAPDKEEVLSLLKDLNNKELRLYALLALNCGMNNTDIGNLHNTSLPWKTAQRKVMDRALDYGHVDWNARRLVRQRGKTKDKGKIPTVCYKLWNETFDLLTEFRSDDPRFCLIDQKTGAPLYFYNEKRKDNIGEAWRDAKLPIKLKELRSGAASLLDHNDEFARYAQHFLGQAPTSVAGKHYVTPSQDRFDACMDWLGEQLSL